MFSKGYPESNAQFLVSYYEFNNFVNFCGRLKFFCPEIGKFLFRIEFKF